MATPLKDSFGPDIPRKVAAAIAAVHPAFDIDGFLADALDGYEALELTPRARHISVALRKHLPADYVEAIGVLMASLGPLPDGAELTGMAAFLYAPHVYFVAQFGLDDWDASMQAQHELTQRFTAEYSIRAFLEREPERTLGRLREWAGDPSPDVRRLVSEGTRPRLPWAPRLQRFQVDPSPVLELLELLKDDPSLYVRRSVANNLNDIGKDHPDLLVETCRRWLDGAGDTRMWVVRHALRSAVKRGDMDALEILGFGGENVAVVENVEIAPRRARIGGSVRVAFDVVNSGESQRAFNVDLRICFLKARGGTSPKVFKVRTLELDAGARAHVSKLISLRQQTTRTHYPGEHRAEAIINGATHRLGPFAVGS